MGGAPSDVGVRCGPVYWIVRWILRERCPAGDGRNGVQASPLGSFDGGNGAQLEVLSPLEATLPSWKQLSGLACWSG